MSHQKYQNSLTT